MNALRAFKTGGEKYPALTGVRALGATVIFFDHFPLRIDAHIVINVMAFFFTLSGFLIFRIYYEHAALNGRWLSGYFVNRFARIYPVYFLLLSMALLLHHDPRPWVIFTNYTLTHALFYPPHLIIQPSWTLTVEECFYFIAPLLMILARVYGFVAPFVVGCLMLAAALIISKLGMEFLGTPAFVLTTTFFGHFAEFFAGAYLALVLMKLEKKGSIYLRGSKRTAAGLAGVVTLVIAMIIVYRRSPLNYRAIILINNFLIPFPIALLYWGLIREDTVLSRLLSSKVSRVLGRGSYSFYLMHMLVIDYVSVPFLLPATGDRTFCVVITLVMTWAASIALFVVYEEPLNMLIRRSLRPGEKWAGRRGQRAERT